MLIRNPNSLSPSLFSDSDTETPSQDSDSWLVSTVKPLQSHKEGYWMAVYALLSSDARSALAAGQQNLQGFRVTFGPWCCVQPDGPIDARLQWSTLATRSPSSAKMLGPMHDFCSLRIRTLSVDSGNTLVRWPYSRPSDTSVLQKNKSIII